MHCSYALNDHINADNDNNNDDDNNNNDDDNDDDRRAFYECRPREILKVHAIAFSRPNPWLIPVNIASLSGNDVRTTNNFNP